MTNLLREVSIMARFYIALHVPSFIQFTGFRIWCSTDLWSAILDISSANVKACSYLLNRLQKY